MEGIREHLRRYHLGRKKWLWLKHGLQGMAASCHSSHSATMTRGQKVFWYIFFLDKTFIWVMFFTTAIPSIYLHLLILTIPWRITGSSSSPPNSIRPPDRPRLQKMVAPCSQLGLAMDHQGITSPAATHPQNYPMYPPLFSAAKTFPPNCAVWSYFLCMIF